MNYKSLYDISWKVDEPEYRAHHALSYSMLSRYEKEGFNGLDKLDEKLETPSLTLGSAVDSIITGGQKEFDDRFFVADFPECTDTVVSIVKFLFNSFKDTYQSLSDIPTSDIISTALIFNYQNNWKPETRAKVIIEKGSEYYKLLYLAGDKTILSSDMYKDVCNDVDALKTSESTKFYFQDNSPFEPEIERLYQLKFKDTIDGIDYRCMADLIITDYKNKTVQPIDLKTSSTPECDFYKSFIKWHYQIQARLYWKLIRLTMDKDDYFKDFELLNYKFIVVNKETLTPLVWDCPFTKLEGDLTFGKNGNIVFPDPLRLGKELSYYLSSRPAVPIGIKRNEGNNLEEWLNKL